jgi:hypothetical protein
MLEIDKLLTSTSGEKIGTMPPPPEWIADHLPEELRREFLAHLAECRLIGEKTAELEREMERTTEDGIQRRAVHIMPAFPPMRSELAELVAALIRQWHNS